MGKQVILGSESRLKMKEGVDILANAVKATLGPRGRHAAIERKAGPPIITKDGVTVARYIDLSDKLQNMGAQLIKSVASEANFEAGDGTTTATVLAQEIYNRGLKYVANGNNPVLLKRGIDIAISAVVKGLKEISLPVHDEQSLYYVATISANNDSEFGKMISQTIAAVGRDGLISVEEAAGPQTEVVFAEGIKLEKGWLQQEFITDYTKNSCEMSEPYILVYDDDVKTLQSLVPLLNQVIAEERQILLIVKNIEAEPLAHLVLNHLKKTIRCCVIKAPGFGDHRRALMEDIALLTGGKLFTNADGQGLKDATVKDLGSARLVSVGQNVSKIIDGHGDRNLIEKVTEELTLQLQEDSIFDHQKSVIKERISRLNGGAAIFKIGAASEGELREKKDRVEDAINAVRSALTEGVVPGGGSALLHCLKCLDSIDKTNLLDEEIIGIKVIKEALKAPFNQILLNAGIEERAEYVKRIVDSNTFSGFDALRLEFVEDMMQRGIIDPTKVVRTALERAASAAAVLLTTEVSICEEVEK